MLMSGDTARRKYWCCHRNKLPRFGFGGHGHQRRSSVSCCSLSSTFRIWGPTTSTVTRPYGFLSFQGNMSNLP
ncbi:hypothetical protein QN277_014057 [Acacia crassicarpa]|uniref:Uncharacterized protein n=1 Tax=Acacia crassicarpa TaxID=499986 RepID=A0AAE1N4S5_9FABA|nr:hypothetical protein QN277_014057 [Acacia crassicarpa]